MFSIRHPSGFYFDPKHESFYIRNNYYRKSPSTQPQEFYKEALLLGKLDLATTQPELLDIPYSPTLRQHYVGDMDDPSFAFVAKSGLLDKIIYSFPATADILAYEVASGRTTLYAPKTRPIALHIKYLNWNDAKSMGARMQSFKSEGRYGKIIPITDRDKPYYVQFCQGVPTSISENSFTYKVHLLVYDEDFNVIFQTKEAMPFSTYDHAFYHGGKLYLFNPNGSDEDKLSFLTVALEGLGDS